MEAVTFAGIHRADDVRVVEFADGFHFSFETFDGGGFEAALARQQLNSHDFIELGVSGLIDGTHAALAQLLSQAVGANHFVDRVTDFGGRHVAGAEGGLAGIGRVVLTGVADERFFEDFVVSIHLGIAFCGRFAGRHRHHRDLVLTFPVTT